MKVLMFGRDGQVASALRPLLARLGETVALGRAEADLADTQGLAAQVARHRPDVVVIAAAYTAVDRAEAEPELAQRVNAEAPGVIAAAAAAAGAWLIHYSTDYVFDGGKPGPYVETDATAPLNAYGRSKRDGELAVAAAGGRHLVFRTSWVHAPGPASFAAKILKLAAERETLRVVADQVGAPTSAALIADATTRALERIAARRPPEPGLHHLAAAGETSWHGYARFVVAEALAAGMALRATLDSIVPIPSSEYPQAARRPLNSRLATAKLEAALGLRLPAWQDGVRETLATLVAEAA